MFVAPSEAALQVLRTPLLALGAPLPLPRTALSPGGPHCPSLSLHALTAWRRGWALGHPAVLLSTALQSRPQLWGVLSWKQTLPGVYLAGDPEGKQERGNEANQDWEADKAHIRKDSVGNGVTPKDCPLGGLELEHLLLSSPTGVGVVLGTIKDLGKRGQTRSNSCSPCRLGLGTNSALGAS